MRSFARAVPAALLIAAPLAAQTPAPVVVSARSDSGAAPCTTQARSRWCWGMLAGGTVPMGDYSKYGHTGMHLGVLAQVRAAPGLSVRAEAVYHAIREVADGSGAVLYEPTIRTAGAALIWEPLSRAGAVHPYLVAGGGLYQLRLVQTCYTMYCTVDYSRDEMHVGVNGGAGLRVVLPGHWNAKGFTLFAESRFHQVQGAGSPGIEVTRVAPISIGFLAR